MGWGKEVKGREIYLGEQAFAKYLRTFKLKERMLFLSLGLS